jgi:hypothetical protein
LLALHCRALPVRLEVVTAVRVVTV